MAGDGVHIAPRRRLEVEEGRLADMAASDLELGYAGVKAYVGMADGAAFVVSLFSTNRPELVAVVEADCLRPVRPGAASAGAANHHARRDATTLGLIGFGGQGGPPVVSRRAALPCRQRGAAR